ncbi:ATRX isoform 12, partial [Pan troglodytes]
TTDGEKKSKKIRDKTSKKKDELSDYAEKSTGKGDSCDSSEDKKSKNGAYGREKKRCKLLGKSSRKRQDCSSSDTEKYSMKEDGCNSSDKRLKRIELRERRNLSSKRNTKEIQSGSSSSDAEESSEDNKKKQQRTSSKKKAVIVKEKKRNSLRTSTKRKQADITSSSSSDIEDDDQNSIGEGSSDEQKIKPVTENLVLSSHTGFCQSSGDEALSKSVPVTVDDDDDDNDPENRYDSICKDFKKIITHPRHGHKQQQRNSKQVVKTRSACLRKTRSQSSCKFERKARKWAKTQKP